MFKPLIHSLTHCQNYYFIEQDQLKEIKLNFIQRLLRSSTFFYKQTQLQTVVRKYYHLKIDHPESNIDNNFPSVESNFKRALLKKYLIDQIQNIFQEFSSCSFDVNFFKDQTTSLCSAIIEPPINRLPTELLTHVFSYLNHLELRQINKEWKQTFDQHNYSSILTNLPIKHFLSQNEATSELQVKAIVKKQREWLISVMGKEKAAVLWTSLSKDVRKDLIILDNCITEYNFYLFYKAIDNQVNIQFDTATSLLESVQLLRIQFLTHDFARFKSIDLSNQQLIELPAEIGKLSNLRELSLSYNQFTSLPAEISNLSKLEVLYLSSNQFTSLPAEISNLSKLEVLYLSSNQFTSLPAEISNLSKLEVLYLSSNQFTSLPAEISNLINLRELSLSYNQFTSLPAEIGNLVNLRELYLSNNQFTSLPAEISNLINLRELSLNNNQFTSLPAEIVNLINLRGLNLSNNQFTSLPAELGNLINLSRLYLSSNQFTSLPAETINLLREHDSKYHCLNIV